MEKAELQQQAIALIERLSTEQLKVVIELLTDLQKRQVGDTAHPVNPNVEIAIKENFKNHARAWKTLAKMLGSGNRWTKMNEWQIRYPSTRI